ncbi:MAG: hypothetical protein WA755_01220 [Candidatus Acidiferrales bacterium]
MVKIFKGAALTALLAVLPLAAMTPAQAAVTPRRAPVAPKYDASREVTLTGTVINVVAKASPGLPTGARMLLATAHGDVYAHLGDFALKGPNSLSLTSGQSVKVVGVMISVKSKQVFLVRTILSGDRSYTIRNSHGFLVPPSVHAGGAETTSPARGGAR